MEILVLLQTHRLDELADILLIELSAWVMSKK